MQWLIEYKDSLEVLSFLGSIIVALVSIFAAVQIYYAKKSLEIAAKSFELTKADSLVRSKREAVVLAAEICERFANSNRTLFRDITEKLEKLGFGVFDWQLNNFDFNKSSVQDKDEADKYASSILQNVGLFNDIVSVVNEIESISIYFVKGAADEEAAFSTLR